MCMIQSLLVPDTSDTSATCVRHEPHKCDTSVAQVRYKCYTNDTSSTQVKIFDFDNDTSENIFTPYISYMTNERLQGEERFYSTFWKCLVRMLKCV